MPLARSPQHFATSPPPTTTMSITRSFLHGESMHPARCDRHSPGCSCGICSHSRPRARTSGRDNTHPEPFTTSLKCAGTATTAIPSTGDGISKGNACLLPSSSPPQHSRPIKTKRPETPTAHGTRVDSSKQPTTFDPSSDAPTQQTATASQPAWTLQWNFCLAMSQRPLARRSSITLHCRSTRYDERRPLSIGKAGR